MTKTKILLFPLLFVLSASAQQNVKLTLQEAIKTGLQNSKNLKLAKAKVDQANAKYDQAVDATIPSLKISGGYIRQSDIDPVAFQFPGNPEPVVLLPNIPNTYNGKATFSETIFSGFRLKYAQQSQKFLQEAVSLDAQKDSDEVTFNIINAYYNIYKIEQSQLTVADNLEQVKQHVKDVTSWEKNGIATHNEVLKWQLQQSNVELAQIDLENNLKIATYNFNLMLGLREDGGIEIDSTSIFSSSEIKSLPDYIVQATASRSDLLAIDLRNKASANSYKVAQNSYYPNIDLEANYLNARPNQRIFPLQDKWNQTWDAGIKLTWDITNLYSNKHKVIEAHAVMDQYEQQKNILTDAVKSEVNQNYLACLESKKKIEVLENSVTQAEENYRITDNKYKNQLVLQSEALDSDNALLLSRINLIVAKTDAQLAYYRLLKACGTINTAASNSLQYK